MAHHQHRFYGSVSKDNHWENTHTCHQRSMYEVGGNLRHTRHTNSKHTKIVKENSFTRFGYPRVIISDNRRQFHSYKRRRINKKWGSRTYYTPIYHPRVNSTERRNQGSKNGLRLRLQDQSYTYWDKHLHTILKQLRNRRNEATGDSSSEALLAYKLPQPRDWEILAPVPPEAPKHSKRDERLDNIHKNQLVCHQKKCPLEEEVLQLFAKKKQNVYIKSHPFPDLEKQYCAGLVPRWLGPFIIQDMLDGRVYVVNKQGDNIRVHAD